MKRLGLNETETQVHTRPLDKCETAKGDDIRVRPESDARGVDANISWGSFGQSSANAWRGCVSLAARVTAVRKGGLSPRRVRPTGEDRVSKQDYGREKCEVGNEEEGEEEEENIETALPHGLSH